MATQIRGGPVTWEGEQDDDGYRTFTVVHRVEGDDTPHSADGPSNVMNTPGLPQPGDAWLIDGDQDQWVTFTRYMKVTPHFSDGTKNKWWTITQRATNKPAPDDKQRCPSDPVEDPLLEPPKVSGSFVNFSEEATHDRFGIPILSSSHEMIRGAQVEFESGTMSLRIEQNVATNYQAVVLPATLMHYVNSEPIWGLSARTVRLSGWSFDRKFHGQCQIYYTRVLEFSIKFDTHDREVVDEGNKVLNGHWETLPANEDNPTPRRLWILDDIGGSPPNHLNPTHFIAFKTPDGENGKAILDGSGKPYYPTVAQTLGAQTAVQLAGAWATIDNATGVHNSEVTTATDTDAVLQELSLFYAPGDEYTISSVKLELYAQASVTSVLAGDARTATVTYYYRTSPSDAYTTLEEFEITGATGASGVTSGFNALSGGQIYDLTTAIGGDWTKLRNLEVRVLVQFSANTGGSFFKLDAAEITLSGGSEPGSILVQKYQQADLTQLGIPLTF